MWEFALLGYKAYCHINSSEFIIVLVAKKPNINITFNILAPSTATSFKFHKQQSFCQLLTKVEFDKTQVG